MEKLIYVGADGCPGGWICVSISNDGRWCVSLIATDNIDTVSASARTVFIDIPIGLVGPCRDGRACDREARRVLGRHRGSSVFPAPARASLQARDYEEALAINRRITGRGISKQSWMIAPKIRVVDELLQANSGLRGVLRESHPEVCFWALNGATPMEYNKKTAEGQRERVGVLRAFFPAADAVIADAMARFRRSEVKCDDVIDALALAVSAWRGDGDYRTLPGKPPTDQVGLAMEMAFWAS